MDSKDRTGIVKVVQWSAYAFNVPDSRVRNYDIPTAIDVLTTGTYQRLPSRIKQVYVAEEKPTKAEMASTLDRLDDVMRMRLLCDELVPPAMKYTVGKGKAKFVVANEFEVTLTIPGPGTLEDVPWRIIGLKILVKPVGGSFQGTGLLQPPFLLSHSCHSSF